MNKQTIPPTEKNKQINKKIDILVRCVLVLSIAIAIFIFAIRPMLNKDYYFKSSEDVSFSNIGLTTGKDSYDVVIIGDEIDGVSAAIGSARVGAKTLLVSPEKELCSDLENSYNVNWSNDISPTGTNVSSDLFRQMKYEAGEGYILDNYLKVISKMVEKQKMLDVLYNARLDSVIYEKGKINSINVKVEGSQRNIKAKRFIDATGDGTLLKKCNVPYSTGYEDIGIDDMYIPLKLNFKVSGVDYEKLKQLTQQQGIMLNSLFSKYDASDSHISISGFNITDQGNSSVMIEGITVKNIDIKNEKQVQKAYEKAAKECMDFYNYLKLNVDQFKTAAGASVAKQFVMPSPYHFKGRYVLTLSDVLTGKRFTDRISTGSRPVVMTLSDGNGYILCNPKIFYMPLRSLIPEGLGNVFMTGDKVSCTSLVHNAISSNSSLAGTGYAAGIIAAYSISKNMEVPKIVEDYNLDTQTDIEKILRKMGIFMSDIKEDISSITGNWSYPYVEKLNNIGLLSAGITNDFKFNKQAKCEDFAYIILNGVPRVSKSAYSFDFDVKIRKYLTNEPLNKDTYAKILFDLDGKSGASKNFYQEACGQGLIDQTMQAKLKNKSILEYADMYYATVKVIEKETGKAMK